jgi:hypothetical protein
MSPAPGSQTAEPSFHDTVQRAFDSHKKELGACTFPDTLFPPLFFVADFLISLLISIFGYPALSLFPPGRRRLYVGIDVALRFHARSQDCRLCRCCIPTKRTKQVTSVVLVLVEIITS